MAYQNIFKINVREGTMSSVTSDTAKQNGANLLYYEEWMEEFFDSKRDIFPVGDSGIISLQVLREAVCSGEERAVYFRRGKDGLRWYEVKVLVQQGVEECLLIVRDIHEGFVEKRKKLRISLYQSMRRNLALLREQGLICGIVVRNLTDNKVCFADRRSKAFYNNLFYEEKREEYRKKSTVLTQPSGGYNLMQGTYTASDCFCIEAEDGQNLWVHLFGETLVRESGKQFQYLRYFCVPLEDKALRPAGDPKSSHLTELVESYLFEWNIEDNHLTLADNWNTKFCAVGTGNHGFRRIERYIYKDDIPKVRKMFNAILSGDIEDNILARFFVSDEHGKEQANWCSISLISVLYDGKVPMYVIGSVRDLSSKLKMVMETTLKEHGVSKEMVGRARLLVDHLICEAPIGSRHALIAIKMRALNEDNNSGMELLIYQYMELVTRMIYPDDIVWVDDCNLMLFLHNVGDDLNARKKAERICRILENRENGELMADVGVAMFPDNGENFDSLMAQVKIDLWNGKDAFESRENVHLGMNTMSAYSSVNIISDILDEWYRTIKTNNVLKERMELTKAQLLLSQIKPHFIYNVLANIKSLIYTDADKAADIVVAFTKYLRVQLNAIAKEEMAPFSKILGFVRNYIEIEKSRFPGKIMEYYDIGYEDFKMPHFILQPVVENAIKHGICKRETPGRLIIRSCLRDEFIVIEVEDDGVGCEVGSIEKERKDGGVGLENVGVRLHHLVKGTIEMESRLGVGTKVTIKIPKKKDDKCEMAAEVVRIADNNGE
ncbi:histidine kinase [Clostridium sp. AM58-1XD]|uniref:sensor histidine kinase n=1 Tax=Clostridium sp. AM58-1XD TaxID=2292307 RepID=UPI000E51D61D|nr:histidine kinase [Clostridium sp. AM58-1XD]RGY97913.1 hypothetical protein DXA13_12655 [Clostridium sp. AM58-1XD]